MNKRKKTTNQDGTYDKITEIKPYPFRKHFREAMKDPELKKAFDELQPKYDLIRAVMRKRIENKISQKQLAKRLGTGQSAVSRLESGVANPSYKFLQKLAKALDSKLVIEFK